ncbi:transcription factor 1 [Salmonella phage CRW-SP2]|nr:transcription factor 1 [Salmonella phage CRW-SP2]
MNRTELVASIAAQQNTTKAEAEKIVAAFLQGITTAVKAGQSVQLVGFGTFEVKHQEARAGRNPLTGAALTIEAKNVVKFKVGESLKNAANGK